MRLQGVTTALRQSHHRVLSAARGRTRRKQFTYWFYSWKGVGRRSSAEPHEAPAARGSTIVRIYADGRGGCCDQSQALAAERGLSHRAERARKSICRNGK